jgi:hypothetical protein
LNFEIFPQETGFLMEEEDVDVHVS